MNTDQKYAGKGNYAKSTELKAKTKQSGAWSPSLIINPGGSFRATVEYIAKPFNKWASQAIKKAKRTNLIADWEKEEAVNLLNNYIKHLEWLVNLYCNGGLTRYPVDENVEFFINSFQKSQADINEKVAYYEIAAFPLPESIKSTAERPSYYYKEWIALGSTLSSIPQGATFQATMIDRSDWLTTTGIIALIYRKNLKTTRQHIFGRVARITKSSVCLSYDNKASNDIIPMKWIKFIYRVHSVIISVR